MITYTYGNSVSRMFHGSGNRALYIHSVADSVKPDVPIAGTRMPQESFSEPKLATQPEATKSSPVTYRGAGMADIVISRPKGYRPPPKARISSSTVVKAPTLQDIYDATVKALKVAK